MGSPDPRGLSAQAGPRITAAAPSAELRLFCQRDPARQENYTFDIRTAAQFGFDSFSQFLPWPILRKTRPRPRFFAFFAAIFTTGVLSACFLPWFWSLLPLTLLALLIEEERHSELRRSRKILQELQLRLEQGEALADLRPRLEAAVQLDAYNDAARLLLSCALLEAGEDVAALVQLAPLRDHHPRSGEVLLVAAATYLHLHRAADALRMLEALAIRTSHPSYLCARHLLEESWARLGYLNQNELPHWGSPLAEELQPEA